MVKILIPIMMTTGAKIPYSPLERGTRAAAEIFAMTRFHDLPNILYTIGFDETKNAITARISLVGIAQNGYRQASMTKSTCAADFWKIPEQYQDFGYSSSLLPQQLCDLNESMENSKVIWHDKVKDIITSDPAAVVIICQRMLDAFHEHLLGLPKRGRKTNSHISKQKPGLFGRGRAWAYVSEVTGRNMLHFHGLGWVGLPQWLTQKASLSPTLRKTISSIFRSAYHSHADPNVHTTNLLRRMNDIKVLRPQYFAPIPNPSMMTISNIERWGQACNVAQNLHGHLPTCRKGPRGKCECRLSYGRPTGTDDVARFILPMDIKDKKANKYITYPRHTFSIPAHLFSTSSMPSALTSSTSSQFMFSSSTSNDQVRCDTLYN